MHEISQGTSRAFNFFLALGLPLILMALLLVFDPASLDFCIEKMFYSPDTGFVGFENILHDRAKQGVIAVGLFAIAGFLLSLFPTPLAVWRRQLGYVVLAMAMVTSIVS